MLLEVESLTANIGDKPILKGIDFKVRKGEVHAIMGPNGSGKSTFSKVLVGHPAYEVSADPRPAARSQGARASGDAVEDAARRPARRKMSAVAPPLPQP